MRTSLKNKMSIFYHSLRVGKNGKTFYLFKFRTLKENSSKESSFASKEQYTWCGRFLRKTKLDELPQIWNVLKGDLNIVGPRPEEEKNIAVIPEEIKNILLSRRPGLTSLSSLHFFEEGQILEKSSDVYRDYWERIKPLKIALDVFYVQHRDLLLDWWIIFKTLTMILKSIFRK
mgnify:CR=1 FL=1